jgi:hypothetical protein
MNLRSTRWASAPTQLLHSATTFIVTLTCARLAEAQSFGLIAAAFLLLTLAISLSMQWISFVWLHDTEADPGAIYRAALVLALCFAALYSIGWALYARWALDWHSTADALIAAGCAPFFLVYFTFRRLLLLQARVREATRLDLGRAAAFMLGLGALVAGHVVLDLRAYLLIVLAAHAVPLALIDVGLARAGRGHAPDAAGCVRGAVRKVFGLQHGDRLNLVSASMNIGFSLSSSMVAPVFISTVGFASLRAYELLIFPTMFAIQTADPIYMNRFRGLARQGVDARRWVREVVEVGALLVVPYLLLYGLLVAPVTGQRALALLVAPQYRADRALVHWLVLLSALTAANAPVRWMLSVLARGRPLLIGSALGFVLSLLSIAWLADGSAAPWVALVARSVYEACLLAAGAVACVLLLRAERRAGAGTATPSSFP